MPVVERLVVLASSKKLAARCVAGISLQTGELDLPPIRRSIITVSLGDAYNGVHYKLAAAVFGIGRP
jgi:hypothetical protein